MRLSPRQKRYMIRYFLLPSLVINIALNGLSGWLVFPPEGVPLWGDPSVAGDTIVATFLTACLMGWIMGPFVTRDLRLGRIPPLAWADQPSVLVRHWPRGSFGASLAMALAFVMTVAPASIVVLELIGTTSYSWFGALAFKTAYAAVLTCLVAPVAVGLALREQRPAGCAAAGP